MSTRARTLGRRVALTVTGVALVAAAGGVAAADQLLPERPDESVEAWQVPVPATDVVLSCTGLTEQAAGTSSDAELSGASAPRGLSEALTFGREQATPPPATIVPLEGAASPLEIGSGAGVASVDAGAVVTAPPAGDEAAFVVGTTVVRTDEGDLRGLAATPCLAGRSSAWLVGGATTTGTSTRLDLRNDGSTPATVSLAGWGEAGSLTLQRTSVVVPAGQQRSVLLEAIAPDVENLAIRLEVVGGQIAATAQVNSLDGLVPAGTDVLTPTGGPSTETLIPGVSVVDTPDVSPGAVRILNPGSAMATVSVGVLGAEGETLLPGAQELVIDPGAVQEIALDGVPAGNWTVRVDSDEPVVAAAQVVRVGSAPPEDPSTPVVDQAWISSVPSSVDSAVALPGLGDLVQDAALVLGASESPIQARLIPILLDGSAADEIVIDIEPMTLTVVDVAALGDVAGVRVIGSAPVSASLILTGEDGLGELVSAIPLSEDPQSIRSATVRLGIE